ncbi:MAG: flagellar hook-basal body complex protein FliE [Planctomycetes bacterium]|nr:flagellar hook-basal body complex protein FliE [Planctomycetota bacterium]
MDVSAIRAAASASETAARAQPERGARGAGGFAGLLGDLIQDANQANAASDRLTESLAKGEPTDIHDVMIAITEADTSFRLVVEVRNRLIDAYQEIQRMPM